MKRNFSLIRKLALQIEADEPIDQNPAEVGYHLALMLDGGLIVGSAHDATTMHQRKTMVQVHGLTMLGCDFLELARDEQRWNVVRKDVPFSVLMELLMQRMKKPDTEAPGKQEAKLGLLTG